MMHRVQARCVIAFLVFTSVALAAVYTQSQAQTLQKTIVANKDNTLYESATGAISNGAGDYFFSGRTNQAAGVAIRRGLLQFDIAGSIPAGSTIQSVSLRLSMSNTRLTTGQATALHRVTAQWGEGTSNAGANEGSGAPATPGDATWLHRSFSTTTWATPGGDFSPAASASISVGAIGSYTWASTPAMVADVQQWLNSPSTNFGWAIIGNEETAQTAKRFDSRENPDTTVRPRLTITYTTTSDVDEEEGIANSFKLFQNYPNPFNPTTNIKFRVNSLGGELVALKVFNLLGVEVATLVSEKLSAGDYTTSWDASRFGSGTYIYRLQAGGLTQTRKMILMK